MKPRKRQIVLSLLMSMALIGLSGCLHEEKDAAPDPESVPDPEPDPEPDNSLSLIELNATAGGFGAQPDDPANKYTYFNLHTGKVLELTDAEADNSTEWHVAFKRTRIKLNGGASGPGSVKGAVADRQEDFHLPDGSPNVPVFLAATAESELAVFERVTDSTALTFEEENREPAIAGDGSSAGWWLYNPQDHTITANSGAWWLIRSARGDSYARMRVTHIAQADKEVTLELFVQGKDDDRFSATPVTWIAAIGAEGGSRCYDFDNTSQVDCTGLGAGSWDIMVDISGRDWNIWTNGTVKGFGKGGAFGKIDEADIGNYPGGTVTAGGEDIAARYQADRSGLFNNNSWYAYSLQGNSRLWPNYRVYAIDTGTARYKLQIIGYYNTGGISGHITLRYAPIPGSGTVNVTLEEWGISLDKTAVKAGKVSFRVTNKGPDDTHEHRIGRTRIPSICRAAPA